MIKFKYDFVRVDAKLLSRQPAQDYHEIIEQKTRDGWRFVQIATFGGGTYGMIGHYELIFEKER